ncbi:MAG TPA: cytidine deaminase [Candidatus Angelobacter sp.]|jgi:cytidine deaminase|nr:cytidine deaminase [Candidatus Angelobacter sp.]
MNKPPNPTQEQLLNLARAAQQNAYAPYSNFKVGAAILLENGEIFTGCNVENASYGLTNCAERSAIFTAVSKLGGANVKIRAVAVVNDHDAPCSPCGACRQVIAEFGPDAVVWYQGQDGIQESTIRQLLPECFSL